MDLFVIEDGHAKPKPEVLLIEPFKSLWESDESEDKTEALKHLTYVNFMCSPFTSNPFRDIDIHRRGKEIINSCFKGNYEPNSLVEETIEIVNTKFLREMSLSYNTLISAKKSIEKINDLMNTYDAKAVLKSGALKYKPTDMVRVQSSLSSSINDLKKLEKMVEQEFTEKSRTISNKTLNPLEKVNKN